MTQRTTSGVNQKSTYHSDVTQLNEGNTLQFRLLADDALLTWSQVLRLWQIDPAFRSFFNMSLVEAPFPAYFWETPPVTSDSLDATFEFVLVNSPQLTGIRTDNRAFSNQFSSAQTGESVIKFTNLGGDATLVVPCPREPRDHYAHLASFARGASGDQQHELWAMVGATLENSLGSKPVWVSTSGLGVYWVHIRLDAYPKYYTHDPYRMFRQPSLALRP